MKQLSLPSIFFLAALLFFVVFSLSSASADDSSHQTLLTEPDIQQAYQRAMNGDVDAQFYLFKLYRSGVGVEHSITNATRWLLSAGENGHAEAQYWLGYIYFFGKSVTRDVDKGMQWYTRSAGQGFRHAQVALGEIYNGWRYRFFPSDPTAAAFWYTKAAEQGHLKSMFIVGCKHYFGHKQLINISQGLAWFQKAAELGDPAAMEYLKSDNIDELSLFCDRVARL